MRGHVRLPARALPVSSISALPPIHGLRPRLRLHHGSQGVVERAFERLNSQRGSPLLGALSLIRILECIRLEHAPSTGRSMRVLSQR